MSESGQKAQHFEAQVVVTVLMGVCRNSLDTAQQLMDLAEFLIPVPRAELEHQKLREYMENCGRIIRAQWPTIVNDQLHEAVATLSGIIKSLHNDPVAQKMALDSFIQREWREVFQLPEFIKLKAGMPAETSAIVL